MKKRIILSIIVICMTLFSINIVNAATNSVSLTTNSTNVKQGGSFTVTLSAVCNDGINGIDTTYEYDRNKLELVSADVPSNNWVSMGIDGTIQVLCNSTSKITSGSIYVLTFKVKDNAAIGNTSISTGKVNLDSDVSASSFTDNAKSVNISIDSNKPSEGNNGGQVQTPTVPGGNNGGQVQTPTVPGGNNGGQVQTPTVPDAGNNGGQVQTPTLPGGDDSGATENPDVPSDENGATGSITTPDNSNNVSEENNKQDNPDTSKIMDTNLSKAKSTKSYRAIFICIFSILLIIVTYCLFIARQIKKDKEQQ